MKELGHGDDSVAGAVLRVSWAHFPWQGQYLRDLCPKPRQNIIFNLHVLWSVQCVVKFKHVLAQPSRHFGPVRSLSLWRGAHFDSQGNLVQRSWQGGLL